MTRYSRPADTLNDALDLGARQAFELDTGDGNGRCSYPRNWFENASAEEITARSFAAYAPPPPPPEPDPTPSDTSLTRAQIKLALFMPVEFGGMGFAEADILAMIDTLPDGQKQAARIKFADAERFHWDNPFIAGLRDMVRSTKGITLKQLRDAWMQAAEL